MATGAEPPPHIDEYLPSYASVGLIFLLPVSLLMLSVYYPLLGLMVTVAFVIGTFTLVSNLF